MRVLRQKRGRCIALGRSYAARDQCRLMLSNGLLTWLVYDWGIRPHSRQPQRSTRAMMGQGSPCYSRCWKILQMTQV